MKNNNVKKFVLAAMFLALGLVLPFLTGQIPTIGQMLSPMHLPVMLCGFICGPVYGAVVGFICPLLRGAMFGMPPIFPGGIAMAFELCTYGLVTGIAFRALKKMKRLPRIYVTLVIAMLIGRVVWGLVRFVLSLLFANAGFSFAMFLSSAFIGAWPAFILQFVLIPLILEVLYNSKLINEDE